MGDDAFGQLRAALAEHGQEQLLRFWDELDGDGRARLEHDLRSLDLDLLDELVVTLVQDSAAADRRRGPGTGPAGAAALSGGHRRGRGGASPR